jgi:hypothetical protein
VEKLDIFPPNVPIPRKRIWMMKIHKTIKNLRREKMEERRNFIRKRKKFSLKKSKVLDFMFWLWFW